jgi:hypothetical protein
MDHRLVHTIGLHHCATCPSRLHACESTHSHLSEASIFGGDHFWELHPLVHLETRRPPLLHAGSCVGFACGYIFLRRRKRCEGDGPVVSRSGRVSESPPDAPRSPALAWLFNLPHETNGPSTGNASGSESHSRKGPVSNDICAPIHAVHSLNVLDEASSGTPVKRAAVASPTPAAIASVAPPDTPIQSPARWGAHISSTESVSAVPMRRSSRSHGSSSSNVNVVRTAFAAAVQQMQEELQENEVEVFSKLGRGGFGTVYHGELLLCL